MKALKDKFNAALSNFRGAKDILKTFSEEAEPIQKEPSNRALGPSPLVPADIPSKKETALSFHKESKCGKIGSEARVGFATGKKGGSSIGSYLKKMMKPQD